MTDEEFAQWGVDEDDRRQSEMANVRSQTDLEHAQRACKARRKAVGLSAAQAARAIVVGQRVKRGESISFAMRTT